MSSDPSRPLVIICENCEQHEHTIYECEYDIICDICRYIGKHPTSRHYGCQRCKESERSLNVRGFHEHCLKPGCNGCVVEKYPRISWSDATTPVICTNCDYEGINFYDFFYNTNPQ